MRSKVVTVFGGSGFLGRYVVQRLAELGATLRVPTRHPDQAIHLKPLGAVGQIVLERWSGGVPSELERMLAGSQAAVNLIGLLHEPRRGDFARLQGQMPGLLGEAANRVRNGPARRRQAFVAIWPTASLPSTQMPKSSSWVI